MRVKKLVPVLMFVMAVVSSFAFRSIDKVLHSCTWFTYIGPQSTGVPATLAQARTRSNWQFFGTSAPTCTGANPYLCAICVVAAEIDTKGTSGTSDDQPLVDVSSPTPTTIYDDLGDPNARPNGTDWIDVDHNSANPITNHIAAKDTP